MRKILNASLLIVAVGCLMSCHNEKVVWKPEDGYISNKSSAIKMAEIVWLNIYESGLLILMRNRCKAYLKEGKV